MFYISNGSKAGRYDIKLQFTHCYRLSVGEINPAGYNLDYIMTKQSQEQRDEIIKQNMMLRNDFTNLACHVVNNLSAADKIKPSKNHLVDYRGEIFKVERPETIPERKIDPTIIVKNKRD